MPAPIQSATAIQKLAKAFGIQGKHPLTLDNSVVPVAILENLSETSSALLGHAWAFARCDATALTEGSIQLTNAGATSSVDLVVDWVRVKAQLVSDILLHVTEITDGPVLLGTANKIWSDGNKSAEVPPGVLDHRTGSTYAAADILAIADLINATDNDFYEDFDLGWTLSPGQKFVARNTTQNVRMEAIIRYSVFRRSE